ncbi:MAG: sporulation protein [Proteobacteria bacterium]|nr:sporulation protein [Pseudomonadota bacterium]
MVLRLLLAALVVANIGYFLWSRGASTESADREPQRLGQQIRPELLEVRRAPAAPTSPASGAAADAPSSGTPPATTP